MLIARIGRLNRRCIVLIFVELNDVLRRRQYGLVHHQAAVDVQVDDPLAILLTTEQMKHRDRLVIYA